MKRKLTLTLLLCVALCCVSLAACNKDAHTHQLAKTDASPAACETAGNTEYYYCEGCDKYFSDEAATTEITLDSTVIAALGHDIEHHDAKAPSYDEVGHKAYDTCKREGCDYTTYEEIAKLVAVTEIKVAPSEPLFVGNMVVGDEATLVASVLPENATDKTVLWASSDETVVSVDENGKMTAVKAGTATITATAKDGSKVACEYAVSVFAKKSVFNGTQAVLSGCSYNANEGCIGGILSGAAITFKIDSKEAQTVNLQLDLAVTSAVDTSFAKHFAFLKLDETTIAPASDVIACGTEYGWSSHGVVKFVGIKLEKGMNKIMLVAASTVNTNVFSLGIYGAEEVTEFVSAVETPISTGTAYYFEGEEAERTPGAYGDIRVNNNTPTARNNTSLENITVNNGATLTYKIKVDKAAKAGLYCSLAFGASPVSGIFVLTVNGDEVEIPNSFTGTANWVTFEEQWLANVNLIAGENVIVLKVTGGCGNYDYMKLIGGFSVVADEIAVQSVKVNTSKELLNVNDTVKLATVFNPVNASDKTVTWSSSDVAVATVSADGTVTGVKAGYADITATAAGGKTSTIRIFVSDSQGTKYEAEDATLNGCSKESVGTHVGGWGEGKSVTFTVDGGEGGKVLLRIVTSVVHADKTDDIGKYYTVKLNGESADLSNGTFACKGVASWFDSTGSFTVEITLAAGNNTIELCGVSGMATCLDYIAII